jgi:serine protease Do
VKLATILGIAFAGLAVAQEARPETPASGQILRGVSDTPWLGLDFGPLSDAVRAHVPELPKGIGFVVTRVAPGSPAEAAGVKPYDVFWKLGDQWIANRAQLATLLHLQKEGEEVKLGMYRSGEALTVPVVLGRQTDRNLTAVLPAPSPVQPDVPVKVLYPAEGKAETNAADGKAVLKLVDGRAEVKIVSSDGTVIYEGPVKSAQGVSLVPEPWRQRVGVLERGLVQTMNSPRPARTRVLPAAATDE